MSKMGYLVSSITLNIQEKGLCHTQEGEAESGEDEICEGMGIGEGQAHDAAQNVGDEI